MIRTLKHTAEDKTMYGLLLDDLQRTKADLDLAYANFEHVLDPDLIDSCIYQLNAVQMRYKFLLGKVKQIESAKERKSMAVNC